MLLRKDNDCPYVLINTKALNNNSLSFSAKGLLAYVLSRPDDWVFCFDDIVSASSDDVKDVERALREILQAGFIVKGED